MSKNKFPDAELATCAGREAGLRRGVYPKLIAARKMKQEDADLEIAKMDAIEDRLRRLAKSSGTFSQIWAALDQARKEAPESAGLLAGLMSSVGQLSHALLQDSAEHLVSQAIQVAVLAIRVAEEGDPTLKYMRRRRGQEDFPAKEPTPPGKSEAQVEVLGPVLAIPEASGVRAEKAANAWGQPGTMTAQLTPRMYLDKLLVHPCITRNEKLKAQLRLREATPTEVENEIQDVLKLIETREGLQVTTAAPQTEELPWPQQA